MLAKENIKYVMIDAEENEELREKYNIMQAPTMVVIQDGKVEKYVNASNIRKYLETL